jgi:hypothetical protein
VTSGRGASRLWVSADAWDRGRTAVQIDCLSTASRPALNRRFPPRVKRLRSLTFGDICLYFSPGWVDSAWVREQPYRLQFWTAAITAVALLLASSATGRVLDAGICLARSSDLALEVELHHDGSAAPRVRDNARSPESGSPSLGTDGLNPHASCVGRCIASERGIGSEMTPRRLAHATGLTPILSIRREAIERPCGSLVLGTLGQLPNRLLARTGTLVLRC